MNQYEPGPVEEYLADDHTMDVMVTAMLRWQEQQTGYMFFDGKSTELTVFILNALQDDRGVPDDRE